MANCFGIMVLLVKKRCFEKKVSFPNHLAILTIFFYVSRDPNKPEPVSVDWPSYHLTDRAFLELDDVMGEHSKKTQLATRPYHFWINVIPDLISYSETTSNTDMCVTSSARSLTKTLTFVTSFIFSVTQRFSWL